MNKFFHRVALALGLLFLNYPVHAQPSPSEPMVRLAEVEVHPDKVEAFLRVA